MNMQERRYSIEHEGSDITASLTRLDEGYFVLVTGGSRTHIGSVSSAGYGDDLEYQFTGHRDVLVSRKWADILYEILKEPVLVACGIHYDGVNREQINAIVDASMTLLEEVKRDLCQER